jgi:Flp pilus assembly pilin Flp
MPGLYLYIRSRSRREDGQALTEYAMLITFVVLALITSVALLGGAVSDYYSTIASAVEALF